MNFVQMNFNDYNPTELFDGIITDPPYKNAIKNKLKENEFDPLNFMQKCFSITKLDACLIVFTNFAMSYDLRSAAEKTGWKFHTYQIWDKSPCRTWISWSIPLRTTEFILYFFKGNFRFNFKNGIIKPKVNRKSFGGSLKNTNPNENSESYGMYEDIIHISGQIHHRRHPTEKPIEFSKIFADNIGSDKFILDPYCGTCNLLYNFEKSVGVDIDNYDKFPFF